MLKALGVEGLGARLARRRRNGQGRAVAKQSWSAAGQPLNGWANQHVGQQMPDGWAGQQRPIGTGPVDPCWQGNGTGEAAPATFPRPAPPVASPVEVPYMPGLPGQQTPSVSPPVQQPAEGGAEVDGPFPWDVVTAARRESWWVRVRRYGVVAVVVMLLVTGVVTIAGKVVGWVRPAAPSAGPPVVSDIALSGVASAAAVDYLSWDRAGKQDRQMALSRVAAPDVAFDGWDGTGRQWADSPVVVGLVRGSGDRAVATVRVRVVPFVGAGGTPPNSSVSPPSDAGRNVAAAPEVSAQGWTAQSARWVMVAVPMALRGAQLVVTAPPALIGSPQSAAAGRAVAAGGSVGDADFAAATRGTVTELLRSYGTGELGYGRASGTTFIGLNGAAVLDSLTRWEVAPGPGGDGAARVGDATVTWKLSGGAGKLTCSYRVELKQQDDRWYLLAISAVAEDVK